MQRVPVAELLVLEHSLEQLVSSGPVCLAQRFKHGTGSNGLQQQLAVQFMEKLRHAVLVATLDDRSSLQAGFEHICQKLLHLRRCRTCAAVARRSNGQV